MSYNPLPQDINNNVTTRISQHDIFDQVVASLRTNQVNSSFYKSTLQIEDIVSVTTTGGGTASVGSGKATFNSGTGATSSVTASSYTTILYTPGFEVYSLFTTTFTAPTSANSTQFVGLWDLVNDGFYMGWNGTTFGTAVMTGGVQTFTPRSSWNGDLLDGSATSKFTRNGVPEAINLTTLNLFRIRFGWLGAAPVVFEVASPDGDWIVFHTIRQPNTSSNPSIQNPNLPLSLRITKSSADSTNLTMTCACWAAGTTATESIDVVNYTLARWDSGEPVNTSLVASTSLAGNISITALVEGAISVGVLTFEVTPDGSNWFPLSVISSTGSPGVSTYNLVNGSRTWQVYVGGYLNTRVRLSTPITGAGTVVVSIRPSVTSSRPDMQVYQPVGSNLHVQVDSGVIDTVRTSTGNAPTAVSVGVTSTSVLPANALRKGAVFTNTSSNTISFGLNGNAAVLNSGITLAPFGTWIMDAFTFTSGAVTAIASGASSNLSVQEMQ